MRSISDINNAARDDHFFVRSAIPKPSDLQDFEGPALPPNFGEKSRKRSKHTRTSSRKKKSKKVRKSHQEEIKPDEKEIIIETKNVANNAATESIFPETVENELNHIPEVRDLPSVLTGNDATRSKWDSSANESENEGPLESVVHSPQTVVPHIVSGVVGGGNLLKDRKHKRADSRKHKKKKKTKEKKRKSRKSSDEEGSWQEATAAVPENEITKRKHSIEISPEKTKRGKWEYKSVKSSKGTPSRLFQKARNVIQAEAQLSTMGKSKSNSQSIMRSMKSSSYSRSRSRSLSCDRSGKRDNRSHSRHRSRSFKSRSSSRSHRRSSSTPKRYSSLGSKSRSSNSRSSGRYSSSRLSSSRSSSKSSYSRSPSSHTSNHDDGLVSSSFESKDRDDNDGAVPAVVNIPRKVKVDATGIVATSTEKMINSKLKHTDKRRMRTDFMENPYPKQSRKRNRMHKTMKHRDKEGLRKLEGPMTAANVRRAEKVKKQKKIKSEKLTWQPPLEYEEEEEKFEDETIEMQDNMQDEIKLVLEDDQHEDNLTRGTLPDTANIDIFAFDEIDNLLSCGIETKTNRDQSTESAQKTRAKYAKLFKQKLLESQKNKDSDVVNAVNQISDDKISSCPIAEELIPSNHENSSHFFENVSGFGKMPKYKPQSIPIPSKPKTNRHAKKETDLTSIWPEENGNTKQEKDLKNAKCFTLTEAAPLAKNSNEIKKNGRFPSVADKITNLPVPVSQPNRFRVLQPKPNKEELVSSENDDDWVNPKIASLRKPITFNIKLPPQKNNQDENLTIEGQEENKIENKRSKKTRKKKKSRKAKEESLSSFEKVAMLLKRHRLKEPSCIVEENFTEKKKKPVLKSNTTSESIPTSLPSNGNAFAAAPLSTVSNTSTVDNTSHQREHEKKTAVHVATSSRMPYTSHLFHNHTMSMHARGFPMPHFPFGAMRMMHVGMQYPSLQLMSNMLQNFEHFQPPLPKDNFPRQPPEPKKERCRLSDKLVSEFFKKKNISVDRLSALLNEDDDNEEIKFKSPNVSPRGRSRHRSQAYSKRRSHSSSDSSSSRSRDRSTSSYDSDRSHRSDTTTSSDLQSDSDSDTESHSSHCRHRRSRSYSSSDYSSRGRSSSYYSRSHSRSRSSSYHRRSRGRTRSSSSDRYSYSSRSDYSRGRSPYKSSSGRSSRRRDSYGSDSDYSS